MNDAARPKAARLATNRKGRADWLNAVSDKMTGYFPQRSGMVLNQLRARGLYPTNVAPTFNRHGGVVTSGFNLAISVSSGDEGDDLVELQLTAEDNRFDKDRLQAPAASEVSLTLDNKDNTEHTLPLYPSEGSTDPLFKGEPFAGPSFLTYQFTAPEAPGTYHFQCDIHPDVMAGQFIVE